VWKARSCPTADSTDKIDNATWTPELWGEEGEGEEVAYAQSPWVLGQPAEQSLPYTHGKLESFIHQVSPQGRHHRQLEAAGSKAVQIASLLRVGAGSQVPIRLPSSPAGSWHLGRWSLRSLPWDNNCSSNIYPGLLPVWCRANQP
jgi:hypothetical protein